MIVSFGNQLSAPSFQLSAGYALCEILVLRFQCSLATGAG